MTRILGPGLYERYPCPVHGLKCVQVVHQSKRRLLKHKYGNVDEFTRIEDHRASESSKRKREKSA